MTIKITFITRDGDRVEAEGQPGDRLLEVAQAAAMPLEGTCEGQMACSTCHVIIGRDWFGKLPPASEDEEDMLDLAADLSATSRLSCQILLTPELEGMEVRIPRDAHDMQGR